MFCLPTLTWFGGCLLSLTHLRNRRVLLAAVVTLSLVPQVIVSPCSAVEFQSRPNVVVILADDLGYGDLACYGNKTFKTPCLDRMAAEGARLTQFNVPMPFCAPSRASLLTGRYPFRCGMVGNPTPDATPETDALGLPQTEITLGQLFKQSGFATCCIGKWHLGHKPEFLPTRRGFDEYLGIPYSNDMRPVQLLDGEKVIEYPVVQATLTRRYTRRAIEFIERHQDEPFFLYLPHAMPHKPLACSEEFYKKSGEGLYADVIAELDNQIGELMAAIKRLDLDEKTLVIFSSDNGPWYGGNAGGLRGMKATTWEGGYRVPCIARWPNRIPAGHVSQSPAVMMDLFVTVLQAAGLALPADRVIDGRDIMPLLVGDAPSPHGAIYGMIGPRLSVVQDGRWKLHVLPARDLVLSKPGQRWIDPRTPDGVTILAPYEQYQPTDHPGLRTGDETPAMALFDLQNDPGEQHNVADQHPDVVARLKALFDQMNEQLPPT